jgi:translation initiation factor IF-2
MFDERGNQVKSATPSTPVAVMGLNELPKPGEPFESIKNEKAARQMIADRGGVETRPRNAPAVITLEDVFAQFSSGETKELNLIVKSDFQGTLQPILDQLDRISEDNSEGIGINVLSAGIGDIGENDVMLAATSSAIILGFNVVVDNAARRSADTQRVDIRLYSVIYKLLEDIELALQGMLDPTYEDTLVGTAEVRQVFRITRVGAIAGSYVQDGVVRRNSRARVLRGSDVLAEKLPVSSLKRINDDVREVRAGFECGIGLDGFNDFEVGDILEFYVTEQVT